MKCIREYPLKRGSNVVAFPATADLLSVTANPDGEVMLFAGVDIGADHNTTRTFNIIASLSTITGTFVGSVVLPDGVAHVFDEGNP